MPQVRRRGQPVIPAVKKKAGRPPKQKVPKEWVDNVLEHCPWMLTEGLSKNDAIAEARGMILDSRNTVTSDAEWTKMWAPVLADAVPAGATGRKRPRPLAVSASLCGSLLPVTTSSSGHHMSPDEAQKYFDDAAADDKQAGSVESLSAPSSGQAGPQSMQNVAELVSLKKYFKEKAVEKVAEEPERVAKRWRADALEALEEEVATLGGASGKEEAQAEEEELEKRQSPSLSLPDWSERLPAPELPRSSDQRVNGARGSPLPPPTWTQQAQGDLLAQGVPREVAQQLVAISSALDDGADAFELGRMGCVEVTKTQLLEVDLERALEEVMDLDEVIRLPPLPPAAALSPLDAFLESSFIAPQGSIYM